MTLDLNCQTELKNSIYGNKINIMLSLVNKSTVYNVVLR